MQTRNDVGERVGSAAAWAAQSASSFAGGWAPHRRTLELGSAQLVTAAFGSADGNVQVISVIPSLSTRTGGPAVNLVNAALALEPLGVTTTIFATDAADAASAASRRRVSAQDLPAGASDLDVRLCRVLPPRRVNFSLALYRALRGEQADLVRIHSLFLFPQWTAYRFAVATGIPYLVSLHGALDPWLRRHGRLQKRVAELLWQRDMLERAAAIHVATEEEREATADVAPEVPRVVVPNGINIADFAIVGDRAAFRRTALDGFEGRVITYLGRLSRKKGIDILLRAFALVKNEFPDTILAVIGPDDEGLRPRLEGLGDALGLGTRVRFTGPVYGYERLAALASADIWVLPSHTENFGTAVIEAMAAGLPVVISENVNIARQARDADAALVCRTDANDLAGSLRLLLADERAAAELARRGRAFVDRYEWTKVARSLRDAYSFAAAQTPITR